MFNGGINKYSDMVDMVERKELEGIMLGRAVEQNTTFLTHVDHIVYGDSVSRPVDFSEEGLANHAMDAVEQYINYVDKAGEVYGDPTILQPVENAFTAVRLLAWVPCLCVHHPSSVCTWHIGGHVGFWARISHAHLRCFPPASPFPSPFAFALTVNAVEISVGMVVIDSDYRCESVGAASALTLLWAVAGIQVD